MKGLTLNIDLDTVDIEKLEKLIGKPKKVNTVITKLGDMPVVAEYEKDYFYYDNERCCYLSFVDMPEYFITMSGVVYREFKNGVKKIKPMIFNDRYYVNLSKHGLISRYAVHKLLATAFIDNPDGYRFVTFKDGNLKNYALYNLEWKKKSCDAPLSGVSSPVDMYDKDGNFIKSFDSLNDAMRETGVNRSNIGAVLSGRTKTAGGYCWRYSK